MNIKEKAKINIQQINLDFFRIISIKIFYNLAIDSDIKRYEEIRKLTTRQGEDYTAGSLLDYEYFKKSLSADLSRQKELN